MSIDVSLKTPLDRAQFCNVIDPRHEFLYKRDGLNLPKLFNVPDKNAPLTLVFMRFSVLALLGSSVNLGTLSGRELAGPY